MPTKIRVLYATQSMDALLLVPELAQLRDRHPYNVDLSLWVERTPPRTRGYLQGVLAPSTLSELRSASAQWYARIVKWGAPSSWNLHLQNVTSAIPVRLGRIGAEDLARLCAQGKPGVLVLVCGPDRCVDTHVCADIRFVEAVAGPRGRGAYAPGPFGGMLARLGYVPSQVVKL